MLLNVHSYYSLRYGTIPAKELPSLARENGWNKLILTDINNTSAVPEFVKACNEIEIDSAAGIEFRDKNHKLLYIGLAKNGAGFKQLNHFLSEHLLEKNPLPLSPPVLENTIFITPFSLDRTINKENEYFGISPNQISKAKLLLPKILERCVALYPINFHKKEDFALHCDLRAIDKNCLRTQLLPSDCSDKNSFFPTPQQFQTIFSELPILIKNSEKIISQCSINFDFLTSKNKKQYTNSRYDDKILLEKLALDGFRYRYKNQPPKALARLKNELDVIDKLNFSAYFLITWDMIRYSMSRGFYHVGRGSGANSITAYCLQITNVDPIELDLYFERFINPKRSTPPDFDIDYSWRDRGDVVDYLFKRYGKLHTALMGTIVTFKNKSPLREFAKVYGFPKNEIDSLIRNHQKFDNDKVAKHILERAERVQNFPNMRSIHAGGVLISEEPLTTYTALDLPPKGLPTTQWDMRSAEMLGFEKIDVLSQRGIGHIQESAEIIKKNRGVKVDVFDIENFKKDENVKDILSRAKTIGCFYIESPAMRSLITKLSCDNYLTLVAASSIIRPGVALSGMMKEYINRFHNPHNIKYLHPVMKEQLSETFGVMVYQEDVLKVCHHYAGLDLAESDVLRRAMSGKMRGKKEFQRIIDNFFKKAKQLNRPENITKEVWRQVESFAGYSFSKAHSASYAVESYQSLWLKAHYPLEFMVGVINNFGGFYRSWIYFHEAKRLGATISLPCINNSQFTTIIKKDKIYMGFIHVLSLEEKSIKQIIKERDKNGKFLDLEDFLTRTYCGIQQVEILIRIGAFSFLEETKPTLLWQLFTLRQQKISQIEQKQLFALKSKNFTLPKLTTTLLEDAYDEIELLEFPISLNWFDLLKTSFRGEILAKDFAQNRGKKVKILGHLVSLKYIKTQKKEIMHFATWIDYKGEFFDSIHFPNTLKYYPFRGVGTYLLLGKIEDEFGQQHILIEKMARLPIQPDPRT